MGTKGLIYILLWLVPLIGFSQEEPTPVNYDDAPVESRQFESELEDKYDGSSFDYEESAGSGENVIARVIGGFLDWLAEIFGVEMSPETYKIVETLLYVIMIAGGLYLMVRLLLGQQATAFFGGNNTALAPILAQEEDLAQIDLQALIDEALQQGDYRLAVRYMFLKALKELSGKRLIEWHFEKTNNDYLRELESDQLKDEFKTVSRLYDYVWYGEFPIDKQRFNQAAQRFEQLQKTINRYG
ncbi:DUF4129 domain-containing protein [Gilvibacter sp.]|uniref:DUF4129 domain-containing protein n=1 Tax=Gilvibacter sp. TaxID=2729997 RepID=UPI0025BAECA6|nr:DUF4129 domain-containing protein [Gilvibacter sp.]NQX78059.1 DUF4129 domain-containing protein [Gilvibacter sp.]